MSDSSKTLTIVLYSDDATVRASIRAALGSRISPESAPHEIIEFATGPALHSFLDANRVDAIILDGEAAPEGGLGICRQIKDEVFNAPPVIVYVGRADDAWLGAWSRADAILVHPVDPFTLAKRVGALLALASTPHL
ncbi:MAG: response regulator [Actinobacteria bacterium]|uniref:Unannotated protein n=1 Tax=freshwater metagenome TaxID=449393 RepID=A0A6J6L9E4_9ZZZZ|nr:response regulator [Actinomycetota bacterium]MSX24468.1 response regulator [Actinomycetota bacterium]MSY45977.1 response regulator [Actinomycetota bacterium]MTB00152.1 response regulator [Actinomycetota bacterium]